MSQPKININSGGGPKPLPMLRSDVRVYRGPLDPDGSPTYNVKDPVTGRFYKFNWEQGLILKSYKPGISAEQLALKVSQGTTVHLSAEDVITFFEDLGRYGLLNVPRTSDHVHTMDRMTQVGWVKWL
ncbi:MAG: hypothetical protein KDK78_10165, partial [Chlamydiia bacterium]|nr:hypothetical protein [Chlamydiia bacterium]